jgi:hypothetical protein
MLAQSASAQETAKGLLAIQARAQGYKCDKPISAKRDAKRSQPDQAFWVIRCERNSYTMRLSPDMAAAYSAPEVGQSLTRSASLVCQ